MKKLFAFILMLTSLSVGCIFPSLGAFAMSDVDISMHEGMNHDMQSHMGTQNIPKDDGESMHECCESPFIDTITPSSNSPISQDDTDNDAEILYSMYQSLQNNSHHKLNSPPKNRLLIYDDLKNTYISLTGIVKNNN